MLLFEAWKKACEDLNHKVTLLKTGTTRAGYEIKMYVVEKKICFPDNTHMVVKNYILWVNEEKSISFVHYKQALEYFEKWHNHYIWDGVKLF